MRVLLGHMQRHEPWWAEWWSAVAALAWVVTNLAQGGMATMPGFEMPLALAPAWVWYGLCVCVPLAQLYALRQNERAVRMLLCCVMAWLWTFLAMAVSRDGVPVPSIVFYVIWALVNLSSIWRLRPRPIRAV